MPDAGILHVDDLAFIRFEGVARVELGEAIRPDDLPVGAAGHHLAFDPGTLERAAGDRDDAAAAVCDVAYLHRWPDGGAQLERERQARWIRALCGARSGHAGHQANQRKQEMSSSDHGFPHGVAILPPSQYTFSRLRA